MAQTGDFVPAWKRLGLKLKKFQDSEPNQPGSEQQSDQPAARNGSALQEDSHVSQSTKDKSKLGKRKNRSDRADVEGESVKRSKHDQEDDLRNGHAVAAEDVSKPDLLEPTASEATLTDKAPPKGDPNYRKKKGGDPNYRKKKESNHAEKGRKSSQSHIAGSDSQRWSALNLAAPKTPRTPSLSPGQIDVASNGSTLLPSTETDDPHPHPTTLATPQRQQGTSSKESSSSLSPPKTDRRKSVTFTPDTKTSDGNSASNLFKKWVSEQKGSSSDFTPAEVAQFTEPPKVHIANSDLPLIPQSSKGVAARKGKKDPSRYLNYLAQYHQDRSHWKFNKAIQNDVLDNALNVFRIPEEYSEALVEYVRGLQGAGVIQRLKERWMKAIEEIDEAERKDPMDEREAMKEAALQERLSKERKRRRLEGDIENMVDHPYSEGYIRRLKRSRAEALCSALKIPMPAATTPQGVARPVPQNQARKRKRRADISSDESSDSSSSEEDSSSEESSEDEASSASSTSSHGEDDSSGAGSDKDSSDESDDSSTSEDDSD